MKALARKASKLAICGAAGLCARPVVRSFSRTDKLADERSKKRASVDNENFNAGVTPHRKRAASISSTNVKKDAPLSKRASAKKNAATKSASARKSPLAKKPVPIAKTASTAKSIAPAAASVSVAKSASVKSVAQNKISAPSVKAIPAKSASQNVKSRRIAKNTAMLAVIAAKDAVASGAIPASTAKQPHCAAKSAPFKSSAAGKS